MPMSEGQTQLLANAISALIGAGSSISIQWLSKRKTKPEAEDSHNEAIANASATSVKVAQEVVETLKSLLNDQKIQLTEQIDRAKTSCNQQIENLKEEYKDVIDGLHTDNESLNIRITNLINENKDLQIQIAGLSADNKRLDGKVVELKRRLSRYEKHDKIDTAPLHSINEDEPK